MLRETLLHPLVIMGHMTDFDDNGFESADQCPSCYEVLLTGDIGEEVECPNCGHVVVIGE